MYICNFAKLENYMWLNSILILFAYKIIKWEERDSKKENNIVLHAFPFPKAHARVIKRKKNQKLLISLSINDILAHMKTWQSINHVVDIYIYIYYIDGMIMLLICVVRATICPQEFGANSCSQSAKEMWCRDIHVHRHCS